MKYAIRSGMLLVFSLILGTGASGPVVIQSCAKPQPFQHPWRRSGTAQDPASTQ